MIPVLSPPGCNLALTDQWANAAGDRCFCRHGISRLSAREIMEPRATVQNLRHWLCPTSTARNPRTWTATCRFLRACQRNGRCRASPEQNDLPATTRISRFCAADLLPREPVVLL